MGILVGLEGIDASGKSSVTKVIVEKMKKKKIKVAELDKKFVQYNDIEIKKYTERIKDMIWYEDPDPHYFVTDQGWIYLHAVWYSILANNILKKMLKEMDIVIVDGWFYKIYCRFQLKENFNMKLLNEIYGSVQKCNHVFLLDVNPLVAWKRRTHFKPTEMGGYDFIVKDPEQSFVEYQTKVADKLKIIAETDKWDIIEADNLSVEQVADKIVDNICKRIN